MSIGSTSSNAITSPDEENYEQRGTFSMAKNFVSRRCNSIKKTFGMGDRNGRGSKIKTHELTSSQRATYHEVQSKRGRLVDENVKMRQEKYGLIPDIDYRMFIEDCEVSDESWGFFIALDSNLDPRIPPPYLVIRRPPRRYPSIDPRKDLVLVSLSSE
uniref:Uncharacterized protein n=1 Tax=Octactis speculum TaxID=3111310 RepID=A0A7S2F9B7_9STRA|mmetsp:Transcript_17606/g.23735  ORF Transcript_17606/g.23735 Transcript_17606/m.23735 type:complete len:158 (+) Transcript_17606:88-561(+)